MSTASLLPAPTILRGEQRPEFLVEESLHALLRETASRFPTKPAFHWGHSTVSYRELLAGAELIGEALTFLQAGPGTIVGLFFPRGGDLLLAQAGISASGSAWLPFDADVPIDRAATCLSSANAVGLLTTRAWADRVAHLPGPVWFLEDLLKATASRRSPLRQPDPDAPAYVIYTSGSTGTPKGIAVSQANICHFLRSENAILGIHSGDTVYQGFSVAFDMSFEEIWISYLVGATLWIAPSEVVSDPDAIADALHLHKISVLHAVPTLMALTERLPAHLRLLNIGGEACPDALSERLSGKGRRVFNTYGPTETTVTASVVELQPGKPVTIGVPLPNYGMMILDANRHPLPVGEIGEIGVFGPGVTLGYLNLPDLTAARFVANPLPEHPDESRLYLTGDLGRITPDGEIHCLGRVDNQVKIRGFRIELDEIAAALSEQPSIATATAVARDLFGSEEIVAFAVASGGQVDVGELRRSLSARLPSYMVPGRIELLGAMPRLTSGKINLDALRKWNSLRGPKRPRKARIISLPSRQK